MHDVLHAIAELPTFSRLARKLLSEVEHEAPISYLAQHPKDRDVMEGTGGVRKLRWSRARQERRLTNYLLLP